MSNISSIAAVLGVLSSLIFIHELGHFLVAKYFGVRVDIFSIGFGTRLWGFKRGDTDYRISMLPLGGYVKMAGEYSADDAVGSPDELMSHPRWQRFFIAAAGPAMNIALAVVLLTVLYWTGAEDEAFLAQPVLVGWLEPNSAAAQAGIQPGDLVTAIDNIQQPTWERAIMRAAISVNDPLHVTVLRGSNSLHFTIVPRAEGVDQNGTVGWYPDEPTIVSQVEPNMPAALAGLQVGDQVVSLDGIPLHTLSELIASLQKTQLKPVQFVLERHQHPMTLTVAPVAQTQGSTTVYRIGVAVSAPRSIVALPLGDAWRKALAENKKNSLFMKEVLGRMVHGQVSMRQVSGPIGMMAETAVAAKAGKTALVEFTALISLNLGLFNLLPFPILDGGMIFLLMIEGLRRRDISLRIKERMYQVAALFLVGFVVLVTYGDIVKLASRFSR